MPIERTLTTDRGDAGRRLDLVMTRHLTDLAAASRNGVQRWIEAGRVRVNGRVVHRVSTRAGHGDIVSIVLPDDERRAPVLPEPGELDCIFEDEHLLIVNKPAGIVSHPTYGHPAGSLLNVLLWRARDWPEGQRPSLVGRLDKLTSGAVVVAKTTDAHARMQRVLAASLSEKIYLAIVYGPASRERGTIDLRLRRHPDDRRRVIATTDDGLESVTRFERLQQSELSGCSVAVMRCQLVTGRMHQLRVHLAASGWPLVGDPKYGEPRWERSTDAEIRSMLQGFPRQALHAWRLAFRHPFTGERVVAESAVPEDMRALMAACRLDVPA